MLDTIFHFIDRKALRIFGIDENAERTYAETRERVSEKDHVLHDMAMLDSKCATLLTHVSIMLALLAIVVGTTTETSWRIIFSVELALYALVATILLRCIDIMGPPLRLVATEQSELDKRYRTEIALRRALYQYMLRASGILTAVIVILIPIKAIT